jgi:hypothetical protein
MGRTLKEQLDQLSPERRKKMDVNNLYCSLVID